MKSTEKQELKRKIARIGIFLLVVFFPMCVVGVLLDYFTPLPQGWLITILVILLFLLFGVFALICEKLDRRKKERMSKKKDPFSD